MFVWEEGFRTFFATSSRSFFVCFLLPTFLLPPLPPSSEDENVLITFSLPLHLYETRAERNSTPSRSFSVHLLILLRLLVEVILILRGKIEEPSTHLCPSLSADCPGPSGLSVFSKLVPVSKSLGRERAKVVALPQTRCTPPPIAQLLPGRASYYSSSHIHPPLPSSTTYHHHPSSHNQPTCRRTFSSLFEFLSPSKHTSLLGAGASDSFPFVIKHPRLVRSTHCGYFERLFTTVSQQQRLVLSTTHLIIESTSVRYSYKLGRVYLGENGISWISHLSRPLLPGSGHSEQQQP